MGSGTRQPRGWLSGARPAGGVHFPRRGGHPHGCARGLGTLTRAGAAASAVCPSTSAGTSPPSPWRPLSLAGWPQHASPPAKHRALSTALASARPGPWSGHIPMHRAMATGGVPVAFPCGVGTGSPLAASPGLEPHGPGRALAVPAGRVAQDHPRRLRRVRGWGSSL